MLFNKPTIIDLPKIEDDRGNLSFIEDNNQIPFSIERVYWIYDVPSGQVRGGYALKKQESFIVSLSGCFEVIVDDGNSVKTFQLNRAHYGLYIPPGIWRKLENFSTNTLGLFISSTSFDEDDYIRDYDSFIEYYSL